MSKDEKIELLAEALVEAEKHFKMLNHFMASYCERVLEKVGIEGEDAKTRKIQN